MDLSYLNSLIPSLKGKFSRDFLQLTDMLEKNEKKFQDEDIELLWKAFEYSRERHKGQKRVSGKPYFEHCYAVAFSLANWQMDLNTIMGGVLHDCLEDTDATYTDIKKLFGDDVAYLVDGVTKLGGVQFQSRQQKQAENIMKMLLSMAKDIRVIIIKFADRLHNMKTIQYLPLLKQRRIAQETGNVYSPLAHRLGMYKVKSELEDLVFKTLEPDSYKSIAKKLRSTLTERNKYINEIITPIQRELESRKIESKIESRTKSISSIHGKLEKRNKPLDEIYDILAIRIIVDDVTECYTVLGYVHQLYKPVHERFKDFIATPKINGYQSLHTTVVGPSGKMVEIQIRTAEMDRTAEIGVAAHWKYKEARGSEGDLDRHIKWLRDLIAILRDESADPREFMNLLQIDLFQDEVFVFTPKGDLIQLPKDSTSIDFAFSVHTEVGLHCLGAKIDGKIVPINTKLKSGQTVEIISSDSQYPNQSWLKFATTSKARTAINRFLKIQANDESKQLGKEILDKTLRKLKMTKLKKDIWSNIEKLGYSTEDEFLIHLGSGRITIREVLKRILPQTIKDEPDYPTEQVKEESFLKRARGTAQGVTVHGIDNVMMQFGKCCNPIPGDPIIGFITRGRGITLHRVECGSLPIMNEETGRFIETEWNVSKKDEFIVRIKVIAEDRKGYLKDITEAISKLNINITSVDIKVDEGLGTCMLVVSVPNLRRLNIVLKKISEIPGTVFAERAT